MLLNEGKTKRIEQGPDEHSVLLVAKDNLTAGDAANVAEITSIGSHKTAQAAHVFSFLEAQGIATAFQKKINDTTLLCDACDMLPIEFVMRRYAWGSYLKRNPHYKSDTPHRFDAPVAELFHKHAVVIPPLVDHAQQMPEDKARELYMRDGVWDGDVFTDPYIHVRNNDWALYPANLPVDTEEPPLLTCPTRLAPKDLDHIMNTIIFPSFMALEQAWAQIETIHGPIALADIKFEVGQRQSDKKFVLADVVDNDSWRIWPGADPAQQLDKQCFRDGHALGDVAEKYALVTGLTSQFSPSAALRTG